jgi:type IV fimbrial biogenesis protein FimT
VKVTTTRGFSLVEVLVVIAILAIVLTIAVPNFKKYIHNTNLKSAGRELAGDILNIKQTAVAQGVNYKVLLSQSGNNYIIVKGGPNSNDVYDYANEINKTPSSFASYVTINSVNYTSDQIVFKPRGTTSAGNITLINDIGSTMKITSNLMGKVSVDYTPK